MLPLNRRGVVLVVVAGLACTAHAERAVFFRPQVSIDRLMEDSPDAQLLSHEGRLLMVQGQSLAKGATPAEAAQSFVDRHGAVFGAGVVEARVVRSSRLAGSATDVTVFQQWIDGAPVENGTVRVVTKPVGEASQAVLVSGRLAPRPQAGLTPVVLSGDEATKLAQAAPEALGLQEFFEPTLVVFYGEGDLPEPVTPVRTWKVSGTGMGPAGVIAYSFFIDATSGETVYTRNEILHADITGVVRGLASPGMLPDIPSNPPVATPLPEIRVDLIGGASVFAQLNGAYVQSTALTSAVSLQAGVAAGRRVTVNNVQGTEIVASAALTAPGTADLLLNAAPSEFTTAQVNAFIHQTLARNYFRDRAPSFTALDTAIPANVNTVATCNASYNPTNNTTNFYNAGNDCVNTAYSSVVAHEYGHHIVNRLGLAQGAFGEGFADTIAIMLYDDPIVGRNFVVSTGGFIRNPDGANQQYPCNSTASHTCGQILGGTWWAIRQNFGLAYGSSAGLEIARQLHVDWAQITAGGIGVNSAHPQTAVEVLTADDDDANLNNGTPNRDLICDAFAQHGIACPELTTVDFLYPAGRPVSVAPDGGTELSVLISPIAFQPAPGTATAHFSIAGGPFQSVPMTEGTGGVLIASFPESACGSGIAYYITTDLVGGGTAASPSGAPTLASFSTVSASDLITSINDEAEVTGTGWTLGAAGDTATTGQWVRADPIGTAAQPENDNTPAPGVNCFFTGQGTVGGALGEADVDGGFTTLISPIINLSGLSEATLSYSRWFSNNAGAGPNEDVFVVSVSNDNGATWTTLETVGPSGAGTSGGWIRASFALESVIPLTSQVRVRFVAADAGTGSLIEAAVDDLVVQTVVCSAPPLCVGDADGSGTINFDDVTAVLGNFASSGPLGDADGSGSVNFDDVTAVLGNFGLVCP